MPSRPASPEDQAALSRRLALLGQELADVRPQPAPEQPPRPWWDEHTRLAEGSRRGAPAPPPAIPEPPVPGRHAARRAPIRPAPAAGDRDLGGEARPRAEVGEPFSLRRGRLLLGPAQLAVVAVVVIMALGVTCWWLARGRPSDTVQLQAAPAATLTSPAATGGGAADIAPAGGASAAVGTAGAVPVSASGAAVGSPPPASVTVDVSGRVRHPGIQVLQTGARVADALTAAGGARPGVDLTALNLAQVLVDGQQVLVAASPGGGSSVVGSVPAGGSGSGSASSSASGSAPGGSAAVTAPVQVVDLNTASADQLDTLPDVGPVTAQSILSWRQAHGRFSSVDELLEVDGIGEVTLGKIAPYVTV